MSAVFREDTSIVFAEHEASWTREKVGRFWDSMSRRYGCEYFSEMVGDSLIGYVQSKVGGLDGLIMDFGCGPGFLLAKLASRNIICEGVDFSKDSVDATARRLDGIESFRGVAAVDGIPTHLEADRYSLVFFVETVEHLLESDIAATIAELNRILRPGGHVVITTPNREQLDEMSVTCPDCGCVFHRMQHMTSWTAASLSQVSEQAGFETVIAVETMLYYQKTRTRRFGAWLRQMILPTNPHLVYIGRKC